jgi:hypothetical protein
MVLFQAIIEVFIGSMLYMATHCLAYGSWIGGMPIRRHRVRSMANDGDSLSEKSLGRLHVPRLAQERIHQVAIVINRPIEIAPFSMHFDVRFINVPRSPRLPMPLSSQLVCKQRGTSSFPLSDRLMGEGPPTLQKHFGHITKAQFVTEPPKDHEEDDIRRIFELRSPRHKCAGNTHQAKDCRGERARTAELAKSRAPLAR